MISVVIMASLRCGFIHTVLTTLTKSLLSFLVHSAEVADTDKTFFFCACMSPAAVCSIQYCVNSPSNQITQIANSDWLNKISEGKCFDCGNT